MAQNEVICPFLYWAMSYSEGTVFFRSFIPFLVHSCIKPGLLTGALGTAGKRRLRGLSDTPQKRRKVEIIQEDAIWTAWGVSHLSEGNKLKSQFSVILSLILF